LHLTAPACPTIGSPPFSHPIWVSQCPPRSPIRAITRSKPLGHRRAQNNRRFALSAKVIRLSQKIILSWYPADSPNPRARRLADKTIRRFLHSPQNANPGNTSSANPALHFVTLTELRGLRHISATRPTTERALAIYTRPVSTRPAPSSLVRPRHAQPTCFRPRPIA
jgi:hypothetical protein